LKLVFPLPVTTRPKPPSTVESKVTVEPLRDEIDDVGERLVEVVGSSNDLSDVGQ